MCFTEQNKTQRLWPRTACSHPSGLLGQPPLNTPCVLGTEALVRRFSADICVSRGLEFQQSPPSPLPRKGGHQARERLDQGWRQENPRKVELGRGEPAGAVKMAGPPLVTEKPLSFFFKIAKAFPSDPVYLPPMIPIFALPLLLLKPVFFLLGRLAFLKSSLSLAILRHT